MADKNKLYDQVDSDGMRARLEEKLKGLESEYEQHIFDNSHETGEKQSLKYKPVTDDKIDSNTEFKDNTDYVLLVSKDRSNTILEGNLRFDEDSGKYLFKEAFGGTGEREIEPHDFYDLLGNKVDDSLESLLDKDQIKKSGRLDQALIKTLEVSFGKDTVDKVLDTSDRVYLKESLSQINSRGKIEFINTIGGLAYLMDAISKSYEVDYNGDKISRAPILTRLYVENIDTPEEALKMSNLVNHNIQTKETSFKEVTDLLMSSQNNPDILYDKVLFLSNAEHYEHQVHGTDNNFIKFVNTMSTKKFDIVNVVVAFTSALIIMAKGFDAKDAFRIAFRMYPPMAGANQSVGFLLTAKGHAERKEIWEAINDYSEAMDNPEKFVEKRIDLLDKRVGDRVEVPDDLKDLDKTEPLVKIEPNGDKLDVTVGNDLDKSTAKVEVSPSKEGDKVESEVESVKIETKDKDGKDVELKVEVRPTEDKVEKKDENSKDIEKKTDQKVEKKTTKKDKVEKTKDKVEKKGRVKDVVEGTKEALEKGSVNKIKEALEKSGYEIEKAEEKPIETLENNEDKDDREKEDKDTHEPVDLNEVIESNSKDDDDLAEMIENGEIELPPENAEFDPDSVIDSDYYDKEDESSTSSKDEDKEDDKDDDENKREDDNPDNYTEDDLLLDYNY